MQRRTDFVKGTDYKIIQDRDSFSYGTDAILLSDFARVRGSVIDIGCASGIIPLRIADRPKLRHVTGVEIREDASLLARENIELNGLGDRISIVNADIRDFAKSHRAEFDCAIANPPYMTVDSGEKKSSEGFSLARHELMLTLRELCESAAMLLKSKGDFFMIHRASRLAEIIVELSAVSLEPKEIRFIKKDAESAASLVLISSKLNGAKGLKLYEDILLSKRK